MFSRNTYSRLFQLVLCFVFKQVSDLRTSHNFCSSLAARLLKKNNERKVIKKPDLYLQGKIDDIMVEEKFLKNFKGISVHSEEFLNGQQLTIGNLTLPNRRTTSHANIGNVIIYPT